MKIRDVVNYFSDLYQAYPLICKAVGLFLLAFILGALFF